MRVLLVIYNFILIFITPIAALFMYIIMRKKNKHQHFFERFGFIKVNDFNPKKSIWFHCASVGEVRSIKNIVDEIRKNHTDYSIIITTMTATGRQTAYDYIKADIAFLLPIESGSAFAKIIAYMNVSCLVIVDTELWPNLIYTASKTVPVFLINARISDKTFKTYKRFKFIFKNVLNQFSAILAKSKMDEERFACILGNNNKVITAGNIKFQERKKKEDVKVISELNNIKYLLLASTHETEEETLLSYMDNKMCGFEKIVIVPRHIERCKSIKEMVINKGYSVSLYSEKDFSKRVVIIDVHIGGHNIFEALKFKKIISVKKNMFSFKEIYDNAKEYGLVCEIDNKNDFIKYLESEDKEYNFQDFFNKLESENKNTLSIITETIGTVLK